MPQTPRRPVFGLDAYSPPEIALRIETQGIERAHLPIRTKLMLGMVGGGLIGIGAMGHTMMVGDPAMNPAAGRVLGGVAFAIGYLAAITAGASVFTTNILMVMTWAAGKIRLRLLLRSWGIVLLGNAVGAGGLAMLVVGSGQPAMHGSQVGEAIMQIAAEKAGETLPQAFFKGMLGNVLICIGAWIAMAGRTITDKMIGPLLPIALLPIAGFEHAVGNLYYFQAAIWLTLTQPEVYLAQGMGFGPAGVARNMVAVILGNVVGGGLLVGLVYHVVYRREAPNAGGSEKTPGL